MLHFLLRSTVFSMLSIANFMVSGSAFAEQFDLSTRSIKATTPGGNQTEPIFTPQTWPASQVALIVCDVWDLHHCRNAVQRLEEFAPRLDLVLQEARRRGAIIIHAPSDCMTAYENHPARIRAMQVPVSNQLPVDIQSWCSQIPSENIPYPIDQSDGGDDDDPVEHAKWVAKLQSLGRNPGTPWQKQSDLISIDSQLDYITDRGDEVWSILEQRGIKHVVLTGVHCNMCVLGRPFGIRQMVRNGMRVVLMRDLTDSMYSPNSWPYVDHYSGHDAVIAYVEQCICPTITSNQLLGGEPFRWKADTRPASPSSNESNSLSINLDPKKQWVSLPNRQISEMQNKLKDAKEPIWFRSSLRIPNAWQTDRALSLRIQNLGNIQLWLNGHAVRSQAPSYGSQEFVQFSLPQEFVASDEYNLLVVKTSQSHAPQLTLLPQVVIQDKTYGLDGSWQIRLGDSPLFSNIPLPAKFGIGPDSVVRVNPKPSLIQHVKIFDTPGRFGVWPANHGAWCWGDEILVGFSAGFHKDLGNERHNIDRDKPEQHLLARSLDGGQTWSIENPSEKGKLVPSGKALHGKEAADSKEPEWSNCPGNIDFTHPDFAFTSRMIDNHVGPSRFHYSLDRGRSWNGPYRLPNLDTPGIAARTDYLVNSATDCFLFVTAGKSNQLEGRPLCMQTTDGGKTWKLVAWIGAEPKGYAIMPSTVRVGPNQLLSAIRCRDGSKSWIDCYRSQDNGLTWVLDSTPVADLGEGNPPSMVRLFDGRICLTYGYRAPPFGIRARISRDQGKTWEDEIHLRDDGGGRDVGYPRTVQRSDGMLVTIYYYHDSPKGERYIASTIWSP